MTVLSQALSVPGLGAETRAALLVSRRSPSTWLPADCWLHQPTALMWTTSTEAQQMLGSITCSQIHQEHRLDRRSTIGRPHKCYMSRCHHVVRNGPL